MRKMITVHLTAIADGAGKSIVFNTPLLPRQRHVERVTLDSIGNPIINYLVNAGDPPNDKVGYTIAEVGEIFDGARWHPIHIFDTRTTDIGAPHTWVLLESNHPKLGP